MSERPAGHDARPYGRRAFIALLAAGVSALWWGEPAWRDVTSTLRVGAVGLPPSGGWRIYTVSTPMPEFDRRSWRLTIDGNVARPLRLSYEELLALPSAEQVSDFHCVTGWIVPAVRWRGVRFRDLLEPAGPLPGAQGLVFTSAERPYVDSLTVEQAFLPDAMLAYEMDGAAIAREHGAPARVVMPQMYGYKNVKWVERITVADRPVEGYWEERGYDRDAWVGRSNIHV